MTNNKQPQAKQDRIFFAAVVKMCLVTILKKKLPVLNKKLTCVTFEQLLLNSFPQSCETQLLRKTGNTDWFLIIVVGALKPLTQLFVPVPRQLFLLYFTAQAKMLS